MDVGRAQTVILFAAFLLVLVASYSNGNRRFAEAFMTSEVSLNIRGIDDETANELWIRCSRELKVCVRFLESLELYLSRALSRHDSPKLDIDPLVAGIRENVIKKSPFQEKQFLFECLRKKNLLHHESAEDFGSNSWFSKCQKLFSRWYVPRRLLRSARNIRRLAQAPAPAASPDYGPAPSHLVPAKSPSPTSQPPSRVLQPPSPEPSPSQEIIPTPPPTPQNPLPLAAVNPPRPPSPRPAPRPQNSSPPPTPQNPPPPPKPQNSPPLATPQNPPPPPAPPPRPQTQNPPPMAAIHPPPRPQNDEMVVIAAGCVAGLALLSMLLFFCINRKKDQAGMENGQKHEKRDEKSLLNLSASDLSAGSSQKSQNLGNFSNKNFKTPPTISNIAVTANSTDSSANTQVATLDASGNAHTLLPPPPGRPAPPPGRTVPPPPGPPPPPPKPPAPAPPPLPKVARAPPPPKPGNLARPSPLGGQNRRQSSAASEGSEKSGDSGAPKAKLKPFFWEKVMANPEHSMVWNEIKAGSFQFNEEMMESLFGYVPADKGKHDRSSSSSESVPMYIQLIDPKKAQNLAILLKALNVTTEEVCDALKEANELPTELVETLLKMAPTAEEELKLRLFNGDVSQLGPAERFLKAIVDIPFAYKRMESLLFMSSLEDEISSITESFATLEVACEELRNSRLFLKLLEAVLKTGNRMNVGTYRGGAMAFKLDTLLKLSDVKGTDGKTTLLHFVVQEIIRSEGLKAARRLRESQSMSSVKTEDLAEDSSQESAESHRSLGLQVVSGLGHDLLNVRKAALIDGDNLTSSAAYLGESLLKAKNFLNNAMMNAEEDSEFCTTLSSFLRQAEADITKLLEEERRIMALVKSTGDYFHGNAGKDEGLRLFVIVRDFLIMLEKTCKDVEKACKDAQNSTKIPAKATRKEALAPSPFQEPRQESLPDLHQRLFPAIKERRTDDSSSDDED